MHNTGDVYTGPGFDACSTPSVTTMSDWGASPYRAVGIYVGGANMACSQTNLTPAWVQQESAAGWTLLPVYVGLQAPNNGCGCAAITPSQASAQGTAAAQDAINQAEAVGISPGNPIYDDMEAYNRTATNTTAVLAFLSAWTTELHAEGYVSGVYSSANSGVTDLVNQYGTGYVEPDELWIADWNNQADDQRSLRAGQLTGRTTSACTNTAEVTTKPTTARRSTSTATTWTRAARPAAPYSRTARSSKWPGRRRSGRSPAARRCWSAAGATWAASRPTR